MNEEAELTMVTAEPGDGTIATDSTATGAAGGSGAEILVRNAGSEGPCETSEDIPPEKGRFGSDLRSNFGRPASSDKNDQVTGKENRTSGWAPDSGDCGNAAE
jgi:hypothetical protein